MADLSPGPEMAMSRRGLLGLAMGVPLLLPCLTLVAFAQAPGTCVNLDALPNSQKGMRRSLGFKPLSPDPKKQCIGCAFFSASTTGCGKCQLLSGGAVSANSVCDSWVAKGKA